MILKYVKIKTDFMILKNVKIKNDFTILKIVKKIDSIANNRVTVK